MELTDVQEILGRRGCLVVFVVEGGDVDHECDLEVCIGVYRDAMGLDFV